MKILTFSRLLGVSLLCLAGSVCAETITYQDNFEVKEGEETTPLDLRNIGASQTAWEATPNAVMVKGSGIRASDDNPFVCRVALPGELKEVTIEADLSPNPVSQGWMSLGIGSGEIGNPSFGGLFLLLRSNGSYSLMFNPNPEDTRSASAIALKSGRIQTWNPDGMNALKLVYDRTSDSVSAMANGEEELFTGLSLKEKDVSLQAGYAGVSGIFATTEGRSVGKFSATISK